MEVPPLAGRRGTDAVEAFPLRPAAANPARRGAG